MKYSASLALLVVVGLAASTHSLPARKRMVYYQQPAAAEWYGSAPQQRFMYMQYVQPGGSKVHARSTQAASALVAGETVATGTYLKDCDHAEADVAVAGPSTDDISSESQKSEDALSAAGAHGASSVAEAYPDEPPAVQVSIEESGNVGQTESAVVVNDDDAKVPRDFNFAAEEPGTSEAAIPAGAAVDEPISVEQAPAAVAADLPAPAPIAPVAAVVPSNRYLPAKKKVIVELDQSPEEDEESSATIIEDEESENAVVSDDVEDEEEVLTVPVKPKYPARRPAVKKPAYPAPGGSGKPSKKPAPAPLPAGTFFPIDFGGTTGGAIAIANSFSTGEGGSATSHAIAYGSPDAVRARVRPNPSKFRH